MSITNAARVARAAVTTLTILAGALLPIATGHLPASAASSPPSIDPAAMVNPFIGTGNGGDTFPGADVPFGMVQWSPDTVSRPPGGGYFYQDRSIVGYSLTHLSGAGCLTEGDVPILPTVGTIGADPTAATEPLVHSAETASPGYYRLDAGGVTTQLTTTPRSGMATFTFPTGSAQGNLLFKLSDSETPVTASQFNVVNDREVDGTVTTGHFCSGPNTYTVHFDMIFNRPFASSGTWSAGGNGGSVTFNTAANHVVQAKVGISYVSTANAALNRTVENPGWDFASVEAAAHQSWSSMLGKIQVGGGPTTVFTTALYHSLLEPNVFSDTNGQYMGFDGRVHQVVAPQSAQYANYSGWDIYRGEVQLEAMLAPQQTSDIITSMLNDDAQSGQLPKWAENDAETYVASGDPADGIIADAYAFGATGFDTGQALADMETEASVPNDIRPGLAYYEQDGYLPPNTTYGCCHFYGAVSTQEEYNVADNAIANFATQLGNTTVAQHFATRAQNWQNVFNPASGFLQPKDVDGQFEPGFSPTTGNAFIEGDSYIYTAMLPFDIAGIMAAEGGDAAWVAYLNGLTSSVTAQGPTQIQMNNEPSFDIPWEYDYAGVPAKTQQVVREIQDQRYTSSAGGLPGNDDLGATSSWYVWSALGGYPEDPGSATLALGSPLFATTVIHLGDGKTITEVAPTAAANAPYVHNLTVDGVTWQEASLPANIFTRGAVLRWALGSTPDPTWGAAPGDAPPSNTLGLLPALGFESDATKGNLVLGPGGNATLTLGAQSMSGTTQQVRWTATVTRGSGIVVGPQTGALTVPSEAKATRSVQIEVPPHARAGRDTVTFSLQTGSGTVLPNVVVGVTVG